MVSAARASSSRGSPRLWRRRERETNTLYSRAMAAREGSWWSRGWGVVALVAFAVYLGAAIYEAAVVAPLWSLSPPASVSAWAALKIRPDSSALKKAGKNMDMLSQTSDSRQISDSRRYARCIQTSKRVRWDLDEDVIRGLYGDKPAPRGKAIIIRTLEIGRISRGKETRQ